MAVRFEIAPSVKVTTDGKFDRIHTYDASAGAFAEARYNYPTFTIGVGDAIYYGDAAVYSKLVHEFNTTFQVSSSGWVEWEYWDGSTWASLTVTDSGAVNTKEFTQDGEVSFTTPGDWATCTPGAGANDDTLRYYIRSRFTVSDQSLEIYETKKKSPPTYSVTGAAPWTFTINPVEMTPHPEREQATHRTMGGSVNMQAATGDGAVRTMIWRDLDQSRWGDFIHGTQEYGKFDRVYFYDASDDNSEVGITDQTQQAYSQTELAIPFYESSGEYEEATWVGGANDRLLVGSTDKFYGVRIEFERAVSKYLTDLIDASDSTPYVDSIQIRFTDSTGNLGGTVSALTFSRDTNAANDGTELFTHDGQIKWTSGDVSGWTAVSLNTMINNTSNLSDTDPVTRDEQALYWAEIQVTFKTGTTSKAIRISEIRAAIDSLYYLATVRSDGTRPYWYLHVPSDLKEFRPRDRRDETWIPIKVLDLVRQPTHVKLRWDATLTYVIATDYEAPFPFGISDRPLDSGSYLSHEL